MIIGITGNSNSGKEVIANYISRKGFIYFSLSDLLRKEAYERNLPKSRDTLIALGNELREIYGENILASRILDKIKKDKIKNAVISSIRNPEEIKEFKKNSDFLLLGIEAKAELRYYRAIKRAREKEDEMTLHEFLLKERGEMTVEKNKQQLGVCFKMSDLKIVNDGSIEELYEKIEELLAKII